MTPRLALGACAAWLLAPCPAALGQAVIPPPAAEPPFAHSPRPEPNAPAEAILLDIEIERDGAHFWRGQLDGRGDRVDLTTTMNYGCFDIVVTGGGLFGAGASPTRDTPARLDVSVRYQARNLRPAEFELAIRYDRPVLGTGPNGQDCNYGIDRRGVNLLYRFPIEPGQTLVLRGHAGFQVKATRR